MPSNLPAAFSLLSPVLDLLPLYKYFIGEVLHFDL